MNQSTDRKSALATTVRHPMMQLSGSARFIALWGVLVFTSFNATALAQSSCPGIHAKILDIRNSTGSVACALFESPVGFPNDFLQSATNIVMVKIRDTKVRCNFLNIPPGTYALAVIHDENMDGKLGTNWLGVPTEGYAFSSGAEASMSAPSFEAASFSYSGENLDLTIQLNY